VTGGAGFIGSNLVHALLGEHEVGVIDDLSTGRIENMHPAAWMRTLDIRDDRLETVVREFVPDVVVHLAAQASVAVSVRDPKFDRAVNVGGTRAVVRAARAAGVRRVISASSAAVYGEPERVPLSEGDRTLPTNPYGASKLEAEQVLADELEGSGTDYASFRFSNVYGPRQDALGEGGVVAVFCSKMAEGEAPVIHGTGAQTRDFIYVGDVVAAIIAALESPVALSEGAGAGAGPAYNISTGMRTSVDSLVTMLRGVSGYLGPVVSEPSRAGDISDSALDPAKAASVFGWGARVPLETGLAMTYRWFARR
jgi:UDP-glucose 4-epimerase